MSGVMKAIACTKYGSPDYLELQEVPKPIPGDDEVLVRVYASTVTAADTMMRKADPFISRFFLGFRRPKKSIIGTGFAGKIEAVGKDVQRFKIGDAVYGETGVNFGANAEYLCLPQTGVVVNKPETISFGEAATLCDGPLTSFNFFKVVAGLKRKGDLLESKPHILVNGAAGSLGTAAVQLAVMLGAEVTGVCSTKNIGLVKSLGADHVIDYSQYDFTQNRKRYDIIFDTVGKSSFLKSKQALTGHGQYLSPVLGFDLLLQMVLTSIFNTRKAKFSATGLQSPQLLRDLLAELSEVIESGKLKPVIDRTYPLKKVAEAHRYVDTGHKKGNVVIIVTRESDYSTKPRQAVAQPLSQ